MERVLTLLLVVAVRVSAACLIAGLAVWLARPDLALADALLRAGIVLLMSAPILRIAVSAAEAVRLRDWMHLAAIVTVAVLLAATVIIALR